jgi:hypothetical protein
MLGLLIDLSTIMPLQLTLTERPIFYLYQNLALGIALFKLGSDIVRSGYLGEAGRVWKVKFDRLQNQGMFRFNVAFFTLDIVLPLVSTLLLLICVPYLIVKLFVRYGDALVVVFTKWLATIPECTWTDTASYLGILGWHTVVLSGGAKECVIPYILSPFLETASLEESSATIWEQDPRMHRAILANTAFQYGFFIFAHLCLLAGVIFGIVLLCRSLEQAAIEDTFVKEKKLVNFQDAAAPQEQEGKEEKKTMETKAAIHVPPPGQPDAVVAH